MTDIESWLKFYHIVFPMMIISFAWTSSYWIKDLINRLCVFVIFMSVYQTILYKLLYSHQAYLKQPDAILEFIIRSIVGMKFFSLVEMDMIALIAFIILCIRYKTFLSVGK